MKLSLKPTDTFFFRDGKPFSRGEQTEASGIFPPFPSTVYGALRTAYISEKGWDKFINGDLKTDIGTKTSHGRFRMKGVFLERKGKVEIIYFPLPMDMLVKKNAPRRKRKARLLTLDNQPPSSNAKTDKILLSHRTDAEYPSYSFLDGGSLRAYLLASSKNSDFSPIFREDYLETEPKTGIQRELHQASKEEKENLYRFDMMRFNSKKKYQLIADVEDIDLPDNGIIKIGGENRPFSYEKTMVNIFEYSDDEKKSIIESIKKKKMFKLYCATPTIWRKKCGDEAWKPKWMNGIPCEKTGIQCRLITAIVGRHETIGGWDMAKPGPKTMCRAVPAGSVYYLELESGNAEDVFNTFHYQNNSAVRANEGFGLTLIGLA